MSTRMSKPLPSFSPNSHQNLCKPTAQHITSCSRICLKKKKINAYLSYLCQNSFIFTITRTVKPDTLLITSSVFPYYSNISWYEMGISTHPAPLTGRHALAQFTPPERGYLWQLIMQLFMHINESVSSHSPLCSEEKQF